MSFSAVRMRLLSPGSSLVCRSSVTSRLVNTSDTVYLYADKGPGSPDDLGPYLGIEKSSLRLVCSEKFVEAQTESSRNLPGDLLPWAGRIEIFLGQWRWPELYRFFQ